MANNNYNKYIRKKFAEYIKETIKLPNIWDENVFGTFPAKSSGLKSYAIHIMKTEGFAEKKLLIIDFFGIHTDNVDQQISVLKTSGKFRSIENFFEGKNLAPYEITLNFIAIFFDLPIKSLSEFESVMLQQDNVKDESKIKKPIIYNKKNITMKIVVGLSIIITTLFLILSNIYGNYQRSKEKIDLINKLSFIPKYADNIVLGNAFNIALGSNISADSKKFNDDTFKIKSDTKIKFYTNNIYNNRFIYSDIKWSFETDPKGEDMNSKYGEPFRKDIIPLIPKNCKYSTIANQNIFIRYNILNESGFTVFVDNIKIEIIDVFKINKKVMHFNVWMPEISEIQHNIEFTDGIEVYPILVTEKLNKNEVLNFALEVMGNRTTENKIYKFRIIVSCNNGKGKRFTIRSDKNYYLGFLNLEP